MAKGVEDTVFYTFNRFIALNEVGGDPSRFGTCPSSSTTRSSDAQRRWPLTMLTTATHDTKRGEDVEDPARRAFRATRANGSRPCAAGRP